MKLKTFILPTQVVDLPPMTRAERTAYRTKHRLCVQCGIALQPNERGRCTPHLRAARAAAKKYRAKNPEYVKRWRDHVTTKRAQDPKRFAKLQRDLYQKRKVDQVCVDCGKKALPDKSHCKRHNRKRLRNSRNHQRRLRTKRKSAQTQATR